MTARARRVSRLLSAVAWCLAVAACSQPADPAHDVDITATDGLVLKGSYFSPGGRGPAILLFHQCNMDRHAWDSLVPDLIGAGFHVLTVDQRGFGGSRGLQLGQVDPQLAKDADRAYEHLLSRPDVDSTRVAAVGASCGVMESLDLAMRHRAIKALVLLSGNANKTQIAYLTATPSLPVFAAVTKYDDFATDIQEIARASKSPDSKLTVYGGTAHGVVMFRQNPDLQSVIVSWLRAQLKAPAGQ